MARLSLNWNIKKLVISICDRLENRFDAFVVIEGNRGLGKSTLAFQLMKKVKQEMKNRGVEGYKFSPRRDLLYARDEVIKFFHDRRRSAVGDEFVLAGFSRDFYVEGQKDLIKIISTNRDHNNFFIGCIPHFKALDVQLKSLTSMRITVVRRGLAIIQTPNKTIYSTDIWDEQLNQKIEAGWIKNGIQRPHYSKLTTFRGWLKFSKLSEKQEAIYQKIKDEKRQIIAKEKGLEDVDETDPTTKVYNLLIKGDIKNTAMLEGMAVAHGIKVENLRNRLRRKLKDEHKDTRINEYYYDDKVKVKIHKEKKQNEITALIQKAREGMQ